MTGPGADKLLFRRRHRLTRATEFQAVYCHGARRTAGPLTIYLLPNNRPDHRLGLSVGRRVGGAVVRNRVKRLLREAFRLDRARFPIGPDGAFDLVVQVRPHPPKPIDDYRSLLTALVGRACDALAKQEPRDGPA